MTQLDYSIQGTMEATMKLARPVMLCQASMFKLQQKLHTAVCGCFAGRVLQHVVRQLTCSALLTAPQLPLACLDHPGLLAGCHWQ
jgi:hypothetical protein